MIATLLNFFVVPTEDIINPGILITKYHFSSKFFGLSSASFALGMFLAGLFLIKDHSEVLFEKFKLLFLSNSVIMIVVGLLSLLLVNVNHFIYLVCFLILECFLGFITILINVSLTSYFQANVDLKFQARFFSLLSFSSNLAIPLGVFLAGVFSEKFGADVTYIINNIFAIIVIFSINSSYFSLKKKV